MRGQSIFHKLVRNENSYSQLLGNMLKRDEQSRKAFCNLLKIDTSLLSANMQISVEQHLPECGRADMVISSDHLLLIVEVKSEVGRGMTLNQMLDSNVGYIRHLEQEAGTRAARIVFLVPGKWKYWAHKEEAIEQFSLVAEGKVRASLLSWEELTLKLPAPNKGSSQISLAADFQLLLAERFGPVSFDEEEIRRMFSSKLEMELFLKLIRFLDEVRSSLAPKQVLESTADEFGFYLEQKGAFSLYVGYWLTFWNSETDKHPLCFGIDDPTAEQRHAFTLSLREVWGQESIPFETHIMDGSQTNTC